MAKPKRSKDTCRNCGQPIVYMQRKDPNEVPLPDSPAHDAPQEAHDAYARDREAYRQWWRSKPYWHNQTMWIHEEFLPRVPNHEGAQPRDIEYCHPEFAPPYKDDPTRKQRTQAAPISFCFEWTKQDSYDRERCNRPVTYSEDGHYLCGMHARPIIERKRQREAQEQERQAREAKEESLNQIIERFEKAGINVGKEYRWSRIYRQERPTGKLTISPDDLVRLADSNSGSGVDSTTVPELEVADGLNPFLDLEIDDDEEEIEWDEEFG